MHRCGSLAYLGQKISLHRSAVDHAGGRGEATGLVAVLLIKAVGVALGTVDELLDIQVVFRAELAGPTLDLLPVAIHVHALAMAQCFGSVRSKCQASATHEGALYFTSRTVTVLPSGLTVVEVFSTSTWPPRAACSMRATRRAWSWASAFFKAWANWT
jgi:hypothetical protein